MTLSALCVIVTSVSAECILPQAKRILAEPTYDLLFSGTAVEVTRTAPFAYRTTFDVNRVWRGTVPMRIDLYVSELFGEIERLDVKGRRWIVGAHKLTDPKVRRDVGIEDDAVIFAPMTCSEWEPTPKLLREFGRGYPPK